MNVIEMADFVLLILCGRLNMCANSQMNGFIVRDHRPVSLCFYIFSIFLSVAIFTGQYSIRRSNFFVLFACFSIFIHAMFIIIVIANKSIDQKIDMSN